MDQDVIGISVVSCLAMEPAAGERLAQRSMAMDRTTFDRVIRELGKVTTRRGGLAVTAAILTGRAGGVAEAGRVRREGPCGNGSRRVNVCMKDEQCCTGVCNTALGATNKDGKGRCRCRHNGQPCTEDRNCCQGADLVKCIEGSCAHLQPSDVMLKQRIEPVVNSLDMVAALRPVRWDWTSESGLGEHRQIGFIAQEVRDVVPEVVGSTGTGHLGIDYAKLVSVLTGAVQEQQAEIADLRARLALLEDRRTPD
jgi:hypothetical protein